MVNSVPMLMFAAVQAAQPVAAAGRPAQAATPACSPANPKEDPDEIVICVEKQDGFRIDPAIMEAKRQAKRKKLKRPERLADNSCRSVGIMGCRGGGGINVMAAALTAAEMARRAANGDNVGEMFVTEPEPDEYQLYLEAKRKREAQRAGPANPEAANANAAEAEASGTPQE